MANRRLVPVPPGSPFGGFGASQRGAAGVAVLMPSGAAPLMQRVARPSGVTGAFPVTGAVAVNGVPLATQVIARRLSAASTMSVSLVGTGTQGRLLAAQLEPGAWDLHVTTAEGGQGAKAVQVQAGVTTNVAFSEIPIDQPVPPPPDAAPATTAGTGAVFVHGVQHARILVDGHPRGEQGDVLEPVFADIGGLHTLIGYRIPGLTPGPHRVAFQLLDGGREYAAIDVNVPAGGEATIEFPIVTEGMGPTRTAPASAWPTVSLTDAMIVYAIAIAAGVIAAKAVR